MESPFPLNSALSFSQLKLSELCASLELQAAASATGGAAFRSVAAQPYLRRDPHSELAKQRHPRMGFERVEDPSWDS